MGMLLHASALCCAYNDVMTTRLRVHFDGQVLIPEGPVDLPVGSSLEVVVRAPEEPAGSSAAAADLASWIEALPPLPAGALPGDLAAQHDHYLYGTPKRP